MIKIWPLLLRLFHWSLVCSIAAAWLTRAGGNAPWSAHQLFGYSALTLVVLRIVAGLRHAAPLHTRWSDFLLGPRATWAYARALLRGHEPHTLGHNPLGAYMIVALLATILTICASGWLYTLDAFWGLAWVENIHSGATTLLWWLVGLHLAGVVLTSIRQRENLVRAMFTGYKQKRE